MTDDVVMPGADAGVPSLRIVTQFLQDLSFENPHGPAILHRVPEQPQLELGVEMNAQTLQDDLYAVDLKLNAKAHRDGETAFVVEVLYRGIFEIKNVPEQDMEPVLLAECPKFLFPYARRVISDATAEGGFPALNLDPIDFAQVYMSRRTQAQGLETNQVVAGTA